MPTWAQLHSVAFPAGVHGHVAHPPQAPPMLYSSGSVRPQRFHEEDRIHREAPQPTESPMCYGCLQMGEAAISGVGGGLRLPSYSGGNSHREDMPGLRASGVLPRGRNTTGQSRCFFSFI